MTLFYEQHSQQKVSRVPLQPCILHMNDGPWEGWVEADPAAIAINGEISETPEESNQP